MKAKATRMWMCALAFFLVGWKQPALPVLENDTPSLLLTFDDGPHEINTPPILATLDAFGIQAVFFWVGNQVRRTGPLSAGRALLVHDAVDRGHIIANHTITHAKLCAVSEKKAAYEIDHNQSIYENLTQLPIRWFRAPYGADCLRLRRQLKERGLEHMHWDMDPQEWVHGSSERTLSYLKRKIRNLKGRGVILLHDTKKASADALPRLLQWIRQENERRMKKGLPAITFINPSDLFAMNHDTRLLRWSGELVRGSFQHLTWSL